MIHGSIPSTSNRFSLSQMSRPTPQATQSLTKVVQGALSPEIKWLGSESVHLCVKQPVMFH